MTSMIETVARWMCEADNGPGHSDRWTHYARMAKAAIAALQAQPAEQAERVDCIGCEGKPTPENTPCGVCGRIAEPSDTGDFVRIPVEAYEFLMGQGPLEGCQFGERHPDRPGAFWWRAVIREREPAEPSAEEVERVARAIYGERDFDRIGADVQEQMFLVSRKAIAALRGGA